jgi:hypothetical protein
MRRESIVLAKRNTHQIVHNQCTNVRLTGGVDERQTAGGLLARAEMFDQNMRIP